MTVYEEANGVRRARCGTLLAILATLLICASPVFGQTQQDSLGEAARQHRQKKGGPKASKVYTDEDLKRLAPGGVSVVGQPHASVPLGESNPGEQRSEKPSGPSPTSPPSQRAPADVRDSVERLEKNQVEARAKLSLAQRELEVVRQELELERVRGPSCSWQPGPTGGQGVQSCGGNTEKFYELQRKSEAIKGEISRYRQEIEGLQLEIEELQEQLRHAGVKAE